MAPSNKPLAHAGAPEPAYPALPQKALLYIQATTLLALTLFISSLVNWASDDLLKYSGFLVVALFSSGMKISVPGVPGTLSLSFLFVLFGVVDLTRPETVVLGAIMTLVGAYWNQAQR